jgi:dipeptidyl aminopeptidase/acylaminoacyl peptidase
MEKLMPNWLLLLCIVFSLSSRNTTVFAEGAKNDAHTAVAVFGRLASAERLSITPTGKSFAAVTHDSSGTNIQVFDAQTLKRTTTIPLSQAKVRQIVWVDDDRLVIVYSATAKIIDMSGGPRENFMGLEFNLKTSSSKALLTGLERSLNILSGNPVRAINKNGENSLVLFGVTFPSNQAVVSLVQRTASGLERLAAEGSRETTDWAVGRSGKVLGEVRYNNKDGRWKVLVGPGRAQLKLVQSGTDLINRPSFMGVSEDETTVFVSFPDGENSGLRPVSVQTGELGDERTDLAQRTILREEGTQVVIGSSRLDGDDLDYEFDSPADQVLWRAVSKAFAGAHVELISLSQDRTRLIVSVSGKDFGFGYYIVDRATGSAKWFGDVYRNIGPKQISERTYIHYAASDGLDIPAYLTLPNNRPAKALPLIILPHGGPFSRDSIGFDWWSQAYASLGYAVLQPQFRGSDGFGLDHLRAGYGEYGRKMQTDLSDGITDLVKKGLVDPKRVAVVGGSYGGYAALAGVTLQNGIYRCAVSVAGPSNMTELLHYFARTAGSSKNSGSRYWHKYLGVEDDRDTKLNALALDLQAEKASAPILLIHGADDTAVPIDQSTRMEAALKRAGKPVEMVTLKGEDHWLSTSETRLEMLTASAAFLERCNPPNQ